MSTAPHILSSSDCTGGVSVSLLPGKQKPGVQLFTSFPMDSELNSWKKALSWFYRKYSSKFTATPRHRAGAVPSPLRTNGSSRTTATAPVGPVFALGGVKAKSDISPRAATGRNTCPVSRNTPQQFFSYVTVTWKQKCTWKILFETFCNKI